jgi:spore cortex formation protein SpoVR/YcgB (stage V sporulation)
MSSRTPAPSPLFEGADWDFDTLHRTFEAIERVARDELRLDTYPAQVEIISSEQMLDAYSSIGMPLMYRHWSFGKHFLHDERLYKKGAQGLAYEIVINSNPCIAYCMEDNSMALQALVMAHAAFGHNHFFKSNHLFRQWTEPESIIDYLEYARDYIAECEERQGVDAVEQVMDAAHALMPASVFRHRRPPHMSLRQERGRRQERARAEDRSVHYLWDVLQPQRPTKATNEELRERRKLLGLPEENLLYFIETHSPVLKPWQRELLRIVRNISQYFYPQKQTKMMNEGCACFVHFHILGHLHRQGQLTDGAMLEILHSHTNVLTQPDFDDPRYSGINPYALGFAMMQDIKRICEAPTDEDREWFPDIAGHRDWRGVLKEAWANYRDESFIEQFLSPTVMRRFHMFTLADEARSPNYVVTAIHDERGFNQIRSVLARMFDVATSEPDIQVVDVDLLGDRKLKLQHLRRDGIPLDADTRDATLRHLRRLWGYEVVMEEVAAA